jgi:hypothetical protein
MVDLTSFIMGIVLVLGVLGVGVVVMMYIQIKRLKNKYAQLEQGQGHIYNNINRIDESLHRRIDGEIGRTDKMYEETNRYVNGRIDNVYKDIEEVYRQMDSRLDRLTNKLNPAKKDLLQD